VKNVAKVKRITSEIISTMKQTMLYALINVDYECDELRRQDFKDAIRLQSIAADKSRRIGRVQDCLQRTVKR